MIVVNCECGKSLQVPPGTKAKKGKCPACDRVLSLVPPEPVAPAADRPPGLWHVLPRRAGAIVCLAFEPAGPLLAAVHESGEDGKGGFVPLWDAASGKELGIVRTQTERLTSAVFAPSGEELITAGRDRGAAVWSVIRGMWDALAIEKRQPLAGHQRGVTCIAASTATPPSASLVATAGDDHCVRLWQPADWSCEAAWETDRKGNAAVAFSPRGNLLAGAWRSRGPVILWDAARRQEAARLKLTRDDDGEDLALAFAAGGETLAVLSVGVLRTWDLATHQVLLEIPALDCQSLAPSPDGRTLALAGQDAEDRCAVRVINVFTGELLQTFSANAGPATSIAYSQQGNLLAAGCSDGTLVVWKLAE